MASKYDLTKANILKLDFPKSTEREKYFTSIHQKGLTLVVRWHRRVARVSKTIAANDPEKYFVFIWRLRFSIGEKRSSMDIGAWPESSQDEAIELCEQPLEDIANGINPVEKRDLERLSKVLVPASVIDEKKTVLALMKGFIEYRREQYPDKESTTGFYEDKINLHILPMWGAYHQNGITGEMWEEYIRSVIREKRSNNLGSQIHATMRTAYTWAVKARDFPEVKANPFLGMDLVKEFKTTVRERFLENESLHKWMNEINTRGTTTQQNILMLQLYQGVRINEILQIKIEDLQFLTKQRIDIVVKGGKPSETMLSRQAIGVIKRQLTYLAENKIKSNWLFPNHRDLKLPYTPVQAGDFVKDVRRDWILFSTHDLRRTMRTWLQKFGCVKEMRDTMLNHTRPKGKDASYDHASLLNEKLKWTQIWADKLDDVKQDKEAFTMYENITVDDETASELADLLGQLT